MRGLTAILAIVICSGCASTAQWVEDNPEEAAWQALHVVDALQTAAMTRDPDCYKEADPITRLIIGERPEIDRVVKWAVGSAVLHYAVYKAVQGTRFEKPMRIGDMMLKLEVVGRNHNNGLRINGDNNLPSNCRRARQ